MLKRTMGLTLLAILVITGMAGTITNHSLTSTERKKALALMKDTKAEVFQSVKGLTRSQLNYKPSSDQWSIRECIYHIALSETKLWKMMEKAMDAPASPAKRAEVKITDEELVRLIEDRSNKLNTFDFFDSRIAPYKNLEAALAAFKNARAKHIKYLRTSTEDLRNHVVQLSFGTIDCYQLCLMIASHADRHSQQMEEVKTNAGFPK